jgi:hypothetical protein
MLYGALRRRRDQRPKRQRPDAAAILRTACSLAHAQTGAPTLCTHSGVAQGPGPSDGTRGARSGPCHCIHALRASVCVASHVIRCPRRQPGTLRHPAPQRKSLALRICADVRTRGSATGSCCTLQPHVAWATARKTRGMPRDTRRGVCCSGRRGARASAHNGRRPCSSAAWPAPFHAMICGYAAAAAVAVAAAAAAATGIGCFGLRQAAPQSACSAWAAANRPCARSHFERVSPRLAWLLPKSTL